MNTGEGHLYMRFLGQVLQINFIECPVCHLDVLTDTDTELIQLSASGKIHVLFDLKKIVSGFDLGSSIVLPEPKQISLSFHISVPLQQPS